jgi:LysM repeat protein
VALRVQAPMPRVTVRPGDSLWLIGTRARPARTWEQLASYNHVPNPNLILVGQVLTLPPVSYVPAPVVLPPAPVSTPPVHHYTAPTRTYTPRSTSSGSSYRSYSHPTYSGGGSGIWGCIGQHESGNNPATNTGNGYYGAFQDTISAWRAGGGGPGLPSNYSYSEQLRVNQNLQAQVGWGAWPNTSRMCGV